MKKIKKKSLLLPTIILLLLLLASMCVVEVKSATEKIVVPSGGSVELEVLEKGLPELKEIQIEDKPVLQ